MIQGLVGSAVGLHRYRTGNFVAVDALEVGAVTSPDITIDPDQATAGLAASAGGPKPWKSPPMRERRRPCPPVCRSEAWKSRRGGNRPRGGIDHQPMRPVDGSPVPEQPE